MRRELGEGTADVKCEVELMCCVQNIIHLTTLAHTEKDIGLQKLAKQELGHYLVDEK